MSAEKMGTYEKIYFAMWEMGQDRGMEILFNSE